MKPSDFQKAGHWPTLLAAFLYFDIGFMAWTSLAFGFAHSNTLAVEMFGLLLGLGGASLAVALALFGRLGLVSVKSRWRTTWGALSGARV